MAKKTSGRKSSVRRERFVVGALVTVVAAVAFGAVFGSCNVERISLEGLHFGGASGGAEIETPRGTVDVDVTRERADGTPR